MDSNPETANSILTFTRTLVIVALAAITLLSLGGCGSGDNAVATQPPGAEDNGSEDNSNHNGNESPLQEVSCSIPQRYRLLPENGATTVPASRPVRLYLDGTHLPATLPADSANAAYLQDDSGNRITLDAQLDPSRCLIEFHPQKTLTPNHDYQLTIDINHLLGGDPADLPATLSRQFRTMDENLLGASFFNNKLPDIDLLTEGDLLPLLRFGGRWVTEMALPEKFPDIVVPDSYLDALHRFCEYATVRNRRSWIQLPVFMDDAGIALALDYLQKRPDHCNLTVFAIGNEVDRIDSDEEQYADLYEWPDYLAALKRIIPLARDKFPDTPMVALDLSSFEEYDNYRAIKKWVVPFCSSDEPLLQEIDFLSIHFYPYTGAQKLWDMLDMGERMSTALAQLPAGCPPLLLGEYNTTYQWRPGSTYPGSGGDAFMPVLSLPAVLHQQQIKGLLHWSLIEPDYSTLGLFISGSRMPRPVYQAYSMLRHAQNGRAIDSTVIRPDLLARAFAVENSQIELFISNQQPIFRRDLWLGGDTADIEIASSDIPPQSLNLVPPFSLTRLQIDPQTGITERQFISYQNQAISTTAPELTSTERHCVPVADFNEPNKPGPDFIGPDYNQNDKIATGGTPLPIANLVSTDSVTIEEKENMMEVNCAETAQGAQCGVSLPLFADTATPDQRTKNWSEAADTALFRIYLSNPDQAALEFQLKLVSNHPAPYAESSHAMAVPVTLTSGTQELIVPWKDFRQPDDTPAEEQQTLQETLTNVGALQMVLDASGNNSPRLQIHSVEICDSAALAPGT